jgi:hypothetical protein
MCRHEFTRSLNRGRRKDYCSDECRRLVDNERRRTRARLKHYQQNIARLRADAAAYSLSENGPHPTRTSTDGSVGQALESALTRAEGIIAGAGSKNRLAGELALLVEAVRNYLDADGLRDADPADIYQLGSLVCGSIEPNCGTGSWGQPSRSRIRHEDEKNTSAISMRIQHRPR